MATLTVSHYIHLTREQRYKWHAGESFSVVGVSVPVWFNKVASSEPAIEVFCKYNLSDQADGAFIKHHNNAYELTIPKEPVIAATPLSNEVWNSLTTQEQDQWYEQNHDKPSLKNILDIKDGGAAYLAFRQYSSVKKNNKSLSLIHFVEIKDIKELLDTMI